MAFSTPEQYNTHLAESLIKIELNEYFKAYHQQFCPTQDITFMEYFLELCHHKHEFCVPHTKLFEYGIMSECSSANVKTRLQTLELKIDEDILLHKVMQQDIKHGGSNKNMYMLKPSAFKLMLMRAGKNSKQTIDVEIYARYYLLLEEVHEYYREYENKYKEKLLSMKDNKIDRLEQKLDKQSENFKQFQYESKKINEEQTEKIDQLLQFGNKLIGQNDTLQLTVDMTRDQLTESLDYLVNKSYHSTIDPDNEAKITHIAVLAPKNKDRKGKTILVRGQVMQINKRKSETVDTHEPVIDMTYNANAINLIENAKQEFLRARGIYIDEFNKPIIEFNAKLFKEILKYNRKVEKYNKTNPTTAKRTRTYGLERKDKLTVADIPVKFNNTSISYESNRHFSYDTVIGFISSMNKKTQDSPIQVDDSE